MPRVKRGVTARASHKKVLKQAKGYYGARSRVFRVAKQQLSKQASTRTAPSPCGNSVRSGSAD